MLKKVVIMMMVVVSMGSFVTGCGTAKEQNREKLEQILEAKVRSGKSLEQISIVSGGSNGFTDEEIEQMYEEVKNRIEAED